MSEKNLHMLHLAVNDWLLLVPHSFSSTVSLYFMASSGKFLPFVHFCATVLREILET